MKHQDRTTPIKRIDCKQAGKLVPYLEDRNSLEPRYYTLELSSDSQRALEGWSDVVYYSSTLKSVNT